jgi:hypothetical protein
MKPMYFTTGPNVVQWPWATSARWMRALVVTCACVALGQLGSDLRHTYVCWWRVTPSTHELCLELISNQIQMRMNVNDILKAKIHRCCRSTIK